MKKKKSIKERIDEFPISNKKKKEIYDDLYSFAFNGGDKERHELLDEVFDTNEQKVKSRNRD